MRRNGYIVVLVAAVAWVTVAIVLGTGAGSGAHTTLPPSGPSPSCLPTTLEHDATLSGTSVDVSPAPGTDTAGPATQISFLGIPVTEIRDVSVEGSQSGYHYGHLYGYFQGDGGSFVPDERFQSGERVDVHALVGPAGSQTPVSFSFEVATPYPTDGIPGFPSVAASPASQQSFVSEPGLQPPTLTVTTADRDPSAGEVMMTNGPGAGQYGPMIFTPQGRLVWFDHLSGGLTALDLNRQLYEGQQDLTWWQGHVLSLGFGQGEDIVMDADYQTVATVHGGNGLQADLHDFQIAPDDIAYITVYNPIRCDLTAVGGARNGVIIDTAVQEIDMKTGLVRWEWHSLDHISVQQSHAPVPDKATPWDWFHLNSIDPEPDGDVLVSGRSTWAAYQLQAGSGQVIWTLGGTSSSFTMGAGSETAWQHDARIHSDGTVTMFDDGSDPRIHYQSRGVRIAVDTANHTARLIKAYPHPTGALLADSQGNVQVLPDRNLVIGWGSIPSVSEVAPDGTLLFDAHLPPGSSSYRAFRFPWTGHPLSAPSVSAQELSTKDSTAVYASWNGATEVASWRVLAGSGPGSLTTQVTMPDSGFESTVTFPNTEPYVAVQALGAGGQLLGTSAAVKVAGA